MKNLLKKLFAILFILGTANSACGLKLEFNDLKQKIELLHRQVFELDTKIENQQNDMEQLQLEMQNQANILDSFQVELIRMTSFFMN